MTDITKCEGIDCEMRRKCWRFMAPDFKKWQSFSDFWRSKKGKECEHFMAMNLKITPP